MTKTLRNAKFIYPLLLTLASCAGPLLAQDSLGWEYYDSVKVDLKSGIFTDRYLPFDAPFYIYGDNADVEAIHLKIIDDDYQAYSDQYDLYDRKSDEDDCNCDCKSLTDKRIEFFRMVRRVENNELETLEREFRLLDAAKQDLDHLLAALDPTPDEKAKTYPADSLEKKITSLKNTIPKLIQHYNVKRDPTFNLVQNEKERKQLIEQLNEINSLINFLFRNNFTTLDVNFNSGEAFEKVLRLRGSNIRIENLVAQSRIDLENLKKFIEKHVGVLLYRNYAILREQAATSQVENQNLTLLIGKHKQLQTWEGHRSRFAAMIAEDSLSYFQVVRPFDPRQCNTICSWNRNMIIGNGTNFYLAVPPLSPNRNYKFFFEITRTVNDTEKKDLQFFVTRSIVVKMDSIVDNLVESFANTTYSNLPEIRKFFLGENFPVLDSRIVKEVISGRLRNQYGQQLKTENILIDRIDDQVTRKRLVDQIIRNKFYRIQMKRSFEANAQSNARASRNSLAKLWIGNKPEGERFFSANKMNSYYMFDTLFQVFSHDEDILKTYLGYATVYQEIVNGVPTGLLPFKNLQQVSLRNLDEVNDYDANTVNAYLKNTNSYASYLARVQKFIEDELLRKGGSRGTLFGAQGVRRTPREAEDADGDLKKRFTRIYFALNNHRTDVIRFQNVYKSYQENIVDVNKQAKFLIDSLLQNNRNIQIAAARATGGISSANFKTRTDWYVTADIGIALLPISKRVGASIAPYFGVNFNTHPLNRQVHYGLISSSRSRKYLRYTEVAQTYRSVRNPFWDALWKGSSFVLGVTVTDLGVDGVRENLISNDGNLNLLTGLGIRLTDAGRISTGAIWTKDLHPNPLIDESRIRANWYVALSFDLDVQKALGRVGQLLNPR